MSSGINYSIEMFRRVLQIFAGIFIFDCPGLSIIRNMLYRLIIKGKGKMVLSSKVLFYVPHGLKKRDVILKKDVRISENVKIDCSSPVTIEDNVWISENVLILNHEHIIQGKELKKSKNVCITEGIVIEKDAWVGANALILPQVRRIGNGAIIGAGSVVTKDVDDFVIVAGNPAKVIGQRE